MALHNTVVELEAKLTLDGEWKTYSLEDTTNAGYLILVKDTEQTDNLDFKEVTKVRLQIGIDSGVEGLIMVIKTYDFDFSLNTGDLEETNERISFIKYEGVPTDFYYRIDTIETDKERYKQDIKINGEVVTTNIALNLITMGSLGV